MYKVFLVNVFLFLLEVLFPFVCLENSSSFMPELNCGIFCKSFLVSPMLPVDFVFTSFITLIILCCDYWHDCCILHCKSRVGTMASLLCSIISIVHGVQQKLSKCQLNVLMDCRISLIAVDNVYLAHSLSLISGLFPFKSAHVTYTCHKKMKTKKNP